jgi:hypothetical protein
MAVTAVRARGGLLAAAGCLITASGCGLICGLAAANSVSEQSRAP